MANPVLNISDITQRYLGGFDQKETSSERAEEVVLSVFRTLQPLSFSARREEAVGFCKALRTCLHNLSKI